jgi:riboflavin biosynthesis pyrimidine reductase
MIETFGQLRCEHGLARISVVGGRSTASRLVDAGLVQDLCLTTTSRQGGEPNTPFYTGSQPPSLEVIVRKQSVEEMSPILFEHLLISPLSSNRRIEN